VANLVIEVKQKYSRGAGRTISPAPCAGCRFGGEEVAKNEGVAFHDGASLHGDGNREDRTDVDEGVEFAVLAASIDAARQVAKKRGV